VALTLRSCGRGLGGDVEQGVGRAAAALSAAGYVIDETDPPHIAEMTRLWRRFVAAQRILIRPLPAASAFGQDTQRYLALQRESEPDVDQYSFMDCFRERSRVMRDWIQFFNEYQLVLGPVSTRRPFPVGADLSTAEAVADIFECHRLTLTANYLGLPAIVVPVGLSAGIPIVAQILAPRWQEEFCLDAAEVIEKSMRPIVPIMVPDSAGSQPTVE